MNRPPSVGVDGIGGGGGGSVTFPRRPRGRPTATTNERYDRELAAFADAILKINSTLDFRISSRGWCYILEEHGLGKGDFNAAQSLINDCRKTGLLPIDICAEDVSRLPDFFEDIDDETPEECADRLADYINKAHRSYTPVSFWDYQSYYIEILVEKIDLKLCFRRSAVSTAFRYRMLVAGPTSTAARA